MVEVRGVVSSLMSKKDKDTWDHISCLFKGSLWLKRADVYLIVKTKEESELPLLEDEYDDDDTFLIADDDQLLEMSRGDLQTSDGQSGLNSLFHTDQER